MPTGQGMQGADICRTSAAGFFFLTQRIEREARTARNAAIGAAVVRIFAAARHAVRLLSSAVRDVFALRETTMPESRRCRTCHPNHYQ